MPFCPKCGASVEGRFCASCGTAMDAPGANPAPPPPGYAAPGYPPPVATSGGLQENVAAALCYSLGFITGILFLVWSHTARTISGFTHFSRSSCSSFSSSSTTPSSLWAWQLGALFLLSPLISLAFFILWLFIVEGLQQREDLLPVVGDIAQKQAG